MGAHHRAAIDGEGIASASCRMGHAQWRGGEQFWWCFRSPPPEVAHSQEIIAWWRAQPSLTAVSLHAYLQSYPGRCVVKCFTILLGEHASFCCADLALVINLICILDLAA